MTLRQCFEKLEGNYDDIKLRMLTDERITKFIKLFLMDKTFEELTASLNKNDLEVAFRAAHTLKGVSQNLSFDRLYKSSFELTEMLRKREYDPSKGLYENVKNDYELAVNVINEYLSSL